MVYGDLFGNMGVVTILMRKMAWLRAYDQYCLVKLFQNLGYDDVSSLLYHFYIEFQHVIFGGEYLKMCKI